MALAGLVANRFAPRRAVAVLLVVCAGAIVIPLSMATAEQISRARADHVPDRVQRELPTGGGDLSNACRDSGVPQRLRRRASRQARALLVELRRNSGALVTKTTYDADSSKADKHDLTVRELAQEQLAGLREDPDCPRDLERHLAAEIG